LAKRHGVHPNEILQLEPHAADGRSRLAALSDSAFLRLSNTIDSGFWERGSPTARNASDHTSEERNLSRDRRLSPSVPLSAARRLPAKLRSHGALRPPTAPPRCPGRSLNWRFQAEHLGLPDGTPPLPRGGDKVRTRRAVPRRQWRHQPSFGSLECLRGSPLICGGGEVPRSLDAQAVRGQHFSAVSIFHW